ncbi:MAG: thioredoxin domain-containing protein [Candidatus Nanoarchaeia archaeon]|nr:thioredoxin domain-containing protein [Candidatus Nanoarchaeia archaeon]
MNRRAIMIAERVLIVILAILLVASITTDGFSKAKISKEDAVTKAINYINTEVLKGQGTATIVSSSDEGSLYKFNMDIGGSKYESYVTKDGTLLLPQGIEMVETESTPEETEVTGITKSDKPVVELFVMSHCPYGTQIEKGIIPVAETLKDKIDFKIKFVDYAMHGEKEVYEQLRQYCIQEEFNDKYFDYLTCFLDKGDTTETCLDKVGIDKTKLKACEDKADTEFDITKNFEDKTSWSGGTYPQFNIYKEENTKYGVQGSPTLVINGAVVKSARDSESLLATICSAFNTTPEECNTKLSSETPSAGFGYSVTGNAAADAGCAS